jgi:hypothetical protein
MLCVFLRMPRANEKARFSAGFFNATKRNEAA